MRKRKLYDGNDLLFDAAELMDKRRQRGRRLVKMESDNASYLTPSGVRFYKEHPFQWVEPSDLSFLLNQPFTKFRNATIEEVEEYYLIEW